MKIVVATTNQGKLRELQQLLPPNVELVSMAQLGVDAPDETGHSFLDNAVIKAQHAAMLGYPAIADDSGLEVRALGGAPGVHSARFAGPQATDEENNAHLLAELGRVGTTCRAARFCCAVALALPDGNFVTATGSLAGTIVDEPRGACGFGYDPHFEIHDPKALDVEGKTLAELPLELKNRISHRARAYANLIYECSRRIDLSPVFAKIGATDPPGGPPL